MGRQIKLAPVNAGCAQYQPCNGPRCNQSVLSRCLAVTNSGINNLNRRDHCGHGIRDALSIIELSDFRQTCAEQNSKLAFQGGVREFTVRNIQRAQRQRRVRQAPGKGLRDTEHGLRRVVGRRHFPAHGKGTIKLQDGLLNLVALTDCRRTAGLRQLIYFATLIAALKKYFGGLFGGFGGHDHALSVAK